MQVRDPPASLSQARRRAKSQMNAKQNQADGQQAEQQQPDERRYGGQSDQLGRKPRGSALHPSRQGPLFVQLQRQPV